VRQPLIALAAIIGVSSKLGYLLPAVIGLESMGIPSPGETGLVLAAVLASQGKLQLWLVLVIAVASAILGDNIAYLIGRRVGREVLERPGPAHARRMRLLAAGDRFFDRHGDKAVFLGRWVALLRVVVAWMAGITEMRFRDFFLWNALGGLTWAVTVGLVAYFAGHAAADAIGRYGLLAAIALGVTLVASLLAVRVYERRIERR